jgi:hypothetical protein
LFLSAAVFAVSDYGERRLNVFHLPEPDLLLDGPQPSDMAVVAVDRQADELAVIGG